MPPSHTRNISRRRFMALSAAAVAAGCDTAREPLLRTPLPAHPNYIIFLSDTLRADHLPCYGYATATAPHISAFAKESILFEACHANATWTLPSTTTVLTGTHPLVHRMTVSEWTDQGRERGMQHQVLSPYIPTMAQHLRSRGYDCGFFQSNPNAVRERGIAQGFGHHYYKLNAKPGEQVDAALEWLTAEAREPFLAYIHLIDPHEPYAADEEAFQSLHSRSIDASIDGLPAAEGERLRDYHTIDWGDFYLAHKKLEGPELQRFSPQSIKHLAGLYDSEIYRVDEAFGRFWAALQETALAERTVMLVTSDHGEAFGEDGYFYHGTHLHDPQTHVPLLIKLPGSTYGLRAPWTVDHCDIMPTLLGLATIPSGPPATGQMLIDREGMLLHAYDRPTLSILDHFHTNAAAWGYRLASGTTRLASTMRFEQLNATDTTKSDAPHAITMADAIGERGEGPHALVRAYYREREYLTELAKTVPEPTWRQTEEFDVEAFRALGYL